MKDIFTIIELRTITEVLKEHRNFDISVFSQYQIKRNLRTAMSACKITNFNDFLKAIKEKDEVYYTILDYIFNEKIALYREPALWRILRDEIYGKSNENRIQVWFPDFSIEELYTFIHLIENENIERKFAVTASHFNPGKIAMAKTSLISKTDIIQAESNYKRYDPDATNSFNIIGTTIKLKSEFLNSKVYFINKKLHEFKSIGKFNIVFYRNRLLYYKLNAAQQNLIQISKYLKGGGYLILGAGENTDIYNVDDKYKIHNAEESIYKRKF